MATAVSSALVFGGSFDPVHCGHVALANRFYELLLPQQLRIIPAGQPWQKSALTATSEQRVSMLRLAFENWSLCQLVIDEQEIVRAQQQQPSYTIETLRQLRAELGPDTCIHLAMGADQLHNLHTWREWEHLFSYANLCVAARPGFSLDLSAGAVRDVWKQRATSAERLRSLPCGGTLIEPDLDWDVSATQLREGLMRHNPAIRSLVPVKVLDYLQQHTIY